MGLLRGRRGRIPRICGFARAQLIDQRSGRIIPVATLKSILNHVVEFSRILRIAPGDYAENATVGLSKRLLERSRLQHRHFDDRPDPMLEEARICDKSHP